MRPSETLAAEPLPAPEGTSARKGLTLIEVLVALLITSLALTAGLRASGALLTDVQRQREQLLAQLCMDNLWVNLHLPTGLPPTGGMPLECEQGGQAFRLNLTVGPEGQTPFRRVDLQVRDLAGRPLLNQAAYLGPR